MLRQDPDVVLIGEMRDLETIETALNVAETGHLVFATLHTNDAAGAITRLLDIGVEPFLLASSLRCVLSQRLVRRICPQCRSEFVPDESYLKAFDVILPDDVTTLAYGTGCMNCFDTGYHGRIAVCELLEMNEKIRKEIMKRSNTQIIRQLAIENGMMPIKQDGLNKVFKKITTLEEVFAQVSEDE